MNIQRHVRFILLTVLSMGLLYGCSLAPAANSERPASQEGARAQEENETAASGAEQDRGDSENAFPGEKQYLHQPPSGVQPINANPKTIALWGEEQFELELLDTRMVSDLSEVVSDEFQGEGNVLKTITEIPENEVYMLLRFRFRQLVGKSESFYANSIQICQRPNLTPETMSEYATLVYFDGHPKQLLLTSQNYFAAPIELGKDFEFMIGLFASKAWVRDGVDGKLYAYYFTGCNEGEEKLPIPYFETPVLTLE